MKVEAKTEQQQKPAAVIMGLVKEAPAGKQRRLLIYGADLLEGGEFAEKAAEIRKKAAEKAAPALEAVRKATASEQAAAEKAAEEARAARKAAREAAEAKAKPALEAIKAAKQAAGLAVVNAALAAYGEKPLPLVITLPNSAAVGLAARFNTV